MMTLSNKLITMFLAFAFVLGLSACGDQSQMEGAAEQASEEAVAEPVTEGESTTTQ